MSRRVMGLLLSMGALMWLIWKAYPLVYRATVLDPALRAAIAGGDQRAICSLVARGAGPNIRSLGQQDIGEATTPLLVAARSGDAAFVRLLVSRKADPNLPNECGVTPLMLAAAAANPEVVRDLLRCGARVNERSAFDSTAIVWVTSQFESSSQEPRAKTAQLLIEAGAEPADINEALKEAEKTPNPTLVRALRAAGGKGLREELRGRPGGELLYAVETADMAALKRLVRAGAPANVSDNLGQTPLMHAALRGDPAVFKFLLFHARDLKGKALDVQDSRGETALIVSNRRGNELAALALLRAGAGVNTRDNDGRSALWYAAYGGEIQSVRALIMKRAELNYLDHEGVSPLAGARKNGHTPVVRVLTQAGAH